MILPDPGPEDIVAQNIYYGVSKGTEFARVRDLEENRLEARDVIGAVIKWM